MLKLETLHGSLTLLEKKLLLLEVNSRSQSRIFIICAEVALDQVKSLLVDFLVLMTLEELQFVQPWWKEIENKVSLNF